MTTRYTRCEHCTSRASVRLDDGSFVCWVHWNEAVKHGHRGTVAR